MLDRSLKPHTVTQCTEEGMFVGKMVRMLIVALLPLSFTAGALAGPVDINRADAATIAKELNGIGASKAKAIVEYREKNGSFKTADDLSKVKGIGSKMIERNRANIRVGEVPKK
jgi:competence protein ComEA